MHPSQGSTPSPTMRGTDAVHGHNNPVRARILPHNIALAVAHDPQPVRHRRKPLFSFGYGLTYHDDGNLPCAGLVYALT